MDKKEIIIRVSGKEYKYYYDPEEITMYEDWCKLSREQYYTKYPHTKPNYNNKVLIDEADKR